MPKPKTEPTRPATRPPKQGRGGPAAGTANAKPREYRTRNQFVMRSTDEWYAWLRRLADARGARSVAGYLAALAEADAGRAGFPEPAPPRLEPDPPLAPTG